MYGFHPSWGLGSLQYASIDAAIQRQEGYAPGTLAYINNNPGNLVYASWESAYGCAPGGAGGFATCPSYAAGQEIQDHLVSTYVSQGDSLQDLVQSWCPLNVGSSTSGCSAAQQSSYVSLLSSATGLDPISPVSQQVSTLDSTTADDTSSDGTGIDLSSLLGTSSGLDWGTIALVAAGVMAVFLVTT